MLTSNWTFNNWSNIYIYTYIELWCSPGHRHAEIHSTGTIPLRQAWSAWLQRQGLSRLLRHDSRGALRSDGVTTKAARLEIQNFRLKGMADGQAGSLMISGWRTPGDGWYFMIFNDIYIYIYTMQMERLEWKKCEAWLIVLIQDNIIQHVDTNESST